MEVNVVENVLKLNDEIAAMNRRRFQEAGVTVVNLIGSPGCGKTELLVQTFSQFHGRFGVIAGDLATTRDADRLIRAAHSANAVVQVNTGRGCHLDANQVRHAIDEIDLASLDVLVIENVGNLICPVGFDLGQDSVVGMFSLADGDDKPAKHPHLVHAADLLILNKVDLAPHVTFDKQLFYRDVGRLNDSAVVVETSASMGKIEPWLRWINCD